MADDRGADVDIERVHSASCPFIFPLELQQLLRVDVRPAVAQILGFRLRGCL
jgi:hypothetical protein